MATERKRTETPVTSSPLASTRPALGLSRPALRRISDVLPTVLEALGVEAPEGVQGRSLLATMRGDGGPDLGARPLQTFWHVTLPNIRTAIVGSSLLAFTLSFDEIPVTFFLTGRDNTLPMYIWSAIRRGITPEINAVGTVIVVLSLGLIVLSVYLLRESDKE